MRPQAIEGAKELFLSNPKDCRFEIWDREGFHEAEAYEVAEDEAVRRELSIAIDELPY